MEVKKTELNHLISQLSKKKNSIIVQTQCAVQSLANPSHQVFIDNVEDPIFVLFIPTQQTIEKFGRSIFHMYVDDGGIDSKHRDVELYQFLDSFKFNDTSKSCSFYAINVSVFHALRRYFTSHGIKSQAIDEYADIFVFDNQVKIDLPKLEERFVLDSIKPEEIDEVNRCWKYSDYFSKGLFTHAIQNYPSVCVRDNEQGGRLACFIIATSFGLQNHLFTYPEYRKKGLAKLVTATHAKILEPLFGASISTVVHKNTASKNMFKTMNYNLQKDHHAIRLGTGEFARSGINHEVTMEFNINF